MSTYAVVDQAGNIINRIILDDLPGWSAPTGFEIVAETGATLEIGGKYQAGVYTPPPQSVPLIAPISPISDRQFFQQLAIAGVITQSEALAAVRTGAIPSVLQALVTALPADQQFAAQMLLSGATVFERNHSLTNTIGASYGWTSSQIDQFFQDAGKL